MFSYFLFKYLFYIFLFCYFQLSTQAAFTLSLEHLIKSKQFSAAFSIIQHTVDTQSLVQFMIIPPQFVEQFHKKMLRFTLSHKEPNFVGI